MFIVEMARSSRSLVLTMAVGAALLTPAHAQSLPKGLHVVTPAGNATRTPRRPAALRLANTQYFSYALPEGWQLGEDGQFALTLIAPDRKALTVMVGNAGMPPGYNPGQFAYQNLSAMRVDNLQLGEGRQVRPIAGFQYAYAFDVRYSVNGVPCQGMRPSATVRRAESGKDSRTDCAITARRRASTASPRAPCPRVWSGW